MAKPPTFARALARAVPVFACSLACAMANHAQSFPAKAHSSGLGHGPGRPGFSGERLSMALH
jgi:hypothetical protein